MTDVLLSTGRVAEMLGCSRQHVVDLCDTGRLPAVRIGTHRRVPLHAVDRLTRPSSNESRAARLLHIVVAGKLVAQPQAVLDAARRNVETWLPRQRPDGRTAEHLRRWRIALEGGVDSTLQLLLDDTDDARDLRSSSPFAGVLDEKERLAVLATARAS